MATVQLFAPPPPAPYEQKSIDFMLFDLDRSGLKPEDMPCYPIAVQRYGHPAYIIFYPESSHWRARINRDENKYIGATGVAPDLWIPPGRELNDLFDDDLWVVEGEKKAASFLKYLGAGLNVVGIGGCWNAIKKKEEGGYRIAIDKLQLLLSRPGRIINVILDSDVIKNKHVGQAAQTLKSCVESLGCVMNLFTPPSGWNGVDDWLVKTDEYLLSDLVRVTFDKLEINRALLYDTLGCALNDKGMLIRNEANGAKLLANHFQAIGVLNDRRMGFIDGATKQRIGGDMMHSKALNYLQGDISPYYPSGAINGALSECIAISGSTDLVKGMVSALEWDGTPRLETWGSQYFGTEFSKLANEWGRLLFTGLVMRILEPGCKVDIVPILCGPQGIGKTTFFMDLAEMDNYSFYKSITDLPGTSGDDRTFKQTITAALVVDLGEGIIFESKKTSSDRLKQFLTDQVDEFRVAYAKANTVMPRGYIFVGTTNRGDQLSDLTGSRRFLYLDTNSIKRLDYADKLQIMAEVVATIKEIKASNWYDLRLKPEDLPQRLREENSHMTSVQEILNTQHYRPDQFTEIFQQILDGHSASTLKETGEQVINAAFLASKLGTVNAMRDADAISRKLTQLVSFSAFPYTIEKARKRAAQIEFKQFHREMYIGHITNDQTMFTCYIVRKK